jgi:hypothetical protein
MVVINFVGLWAFNYWQYQKLDAVSRLSVGKVTTSPTSTLVSVPVPSASVAAEQAKYDQLQQRVTALEGKAKTVSLKTTPTTTATAATLFLGSGSTINRDWTTIPGASVSFKTSEYPGLSNARFEAALGIVGGEAQARLIEKSTGAILDITTVFNNTDTSTWKYSPVFSLSAGDHELVVQLRSTSGEVARLEGARLTLMP